MWALVAVTVILACVSFVLARRVNRLRRSTQVRFPGGKDAFEPEPFLTWNELLDFDNYVPEARPALWALGLSMLATAAGTIALIVLWASPAR